MILGPSRNYRDRGVSAESVQPAVVTSTTWVAKPTKSEFSVPSSSPLQDGIVILGLGFSKSQINHMNK